MNVRAIVLVLALCSLVSTSVGSYFYYNSVKETAVKEAEVEFAARSKLLHEHVYRRISSEELVARSLGRFEELRDAISDTSPETLSRADRVMDHFATGLGHDACFLMDGQGTVLASTNRNEPDSFVGRNYSFRPYFLDAARGVPRVYVAVGATTGQRGLFFSHPLYRSGTSQTIGAIVIKASVHNLETEMGHLSGGIALLVHSSGMIFASNHQDWVLTFLWKVSPEEMARIVETRQFGKGPWGWSGLEPRGQNHAVDSHGNLYAMSGQALDNCPEWRTIYLQNVSSMHGKLIAPRPAWTGYTLCVLMTFVGGAVLFLYVMAQREILSRKRAEDVLMEERARFESLAESAPFGMAMISSDDRFVYINSSFKKEFGYDLVDIRTGKDWFRKAFPDPAYRHTVIAAWIEDLATARQNEPRPRVFTVTCTEGTQKIVHFISVQLNTGEHLLTCEDITERWHAEDKLRKSEDEFRRIIANLQDVFYRTNMKGTLTFVSSASERIIGYTPDECLGRSVAEFYVNQAERFQFMRFILENGFVDDYEVRLAHKSGGEVWVSVSSRLFRDEEGNPAGIEGLARDISDRKQMEIALIESEEKFRLLTEQSLMSVAILQNGVYRYANEAMASLLGYTVEEIVLWGAEEFLKVVYPDDCSLVLQQARMKQIGDPAQEPNYEFRIVTKSGTIKWVEIYSKTVQFQGSAANLLTMIDVTERKAAEEERKLYAQRLEALLQLGHMRDAPLKDLAAFALEEAVRLTGSSIGYVAFTNEDESVLTMHAWSQEAMRQCSLSEKPLIYPVAHTGLWGEAIRQRCPVITNDYAAPNDGKKGIPEGHVFLSRHMNVPVFDDGRIVLVAGVGNKHADYDDNDVRQLTLLMEGMWRIVRRKRAEDALQESEERFRIAFQTSPDAANINRSKDGVYIDINAGFTELTGYTREEVLGKSVAEINIWHEAEDRERLIERLKESGQVTNLEARFRLKDGRVRTGLVSARNIVLDGEPHILSVTRDVDDWKKAEQALMESEQRYKDLFDNSTDLIYTHDLKGNLTSVNEAVTKILGYTPQDCANLNVTQIIHPEYVRPMQQKVEGGIDRVAGRRGPYEIAARAKDGHLVWLEVTSRLIYQRGKAVGIHGTARDITARKEAEAERSRLVTAIEQTGETIFITDPEGKILYVNPAFEVTTGYAREEVVGTKATILKSGKQRDAVYTDLWQTLLNGDVWRGRFVNKRKDGTLYQENATISPVKDETGRIINFVAVQRDVSAELILQKQLLQAQKMEAIGTLAGGIAHDFNNLLQAILGYADLLLLRMRSNDPERKKIEIIHRAARDGADLVSRILTFSRRAEAKARPIDLNEEIRRAAKLLRRTVPKMIEIKLSLADDLGIIDADPAEMEQMFLNLGVNAQHAMPDGGELLIETCNISLRDDYLLTQLGAIPGTYVLVTVSDTGIGMSQDVVDRIFEPFFTTKTNGEGTGLGLSMVHGIVSRHSGHIRCYSEPKRGTSFKIYLPVSKTEHLLESPETHELLPSGSETILLVDDDDRIREMAREMIERQGYQVLAAHNGEEALEIFATHGETIALVILDLIMPGMGGKRCLDELLRIDKDVKVILASGYSSNGLDPNETGGGARGFIGKPYDASRILSAIRKVLDTGQL